MNINGSTITKLPNDIDPQRIIEKTVYEKYHICPFCGENRSYEMRHVNGRLMDTGVRQKSYPDYYYGLPRDGKFWWLKFWRKRHRWRKDKYQCFNCGAEWESEWYPTDIDGLDGDVAYHLD